MKRGSEWRRKMAWGKKYQEEVAVTMGVHVGVQTGYGRFHGEGVFCSEIMHGTLFEPSRRKKCPGGGREYH